MRALPATTGGAIQGCPNILLIMTDDQGFGVSGTFGGVIPTPALDCVAVQEGREVTSTMIW